MSTLKTVFNKLTKEEKVELKSDVLKIREKAEKEMDEFGSKTKELGIDFRKTKQFREFQELKKILLSRESSIREKQKEISKIL
jgi:hypothetical protein